MTQTVRITNDIITNALFLIGELGVAETPDAFMLSTGLEIINEILDMHSVSGFYIPFITTFNFNTEANKANYSVSDMTPSDITENRIVELLYVNYTLTGTTYPLQIITKTPFNDNSRFLSPTTPSYVLLNKQALQSFITFYATPDQVYAMTVQAKLMLNKLAPQDTLDGLPPSYYGYLKYAAARKFKQYYPSSNWTKESEAEYQNYYQMITSGADVDMSIRPSKILLGSNFYVKDNIASYGNA